MAYQPKLKIGGSEIMDILTVSYGVTSGTNANGEFTQQRGCAGITIGRKVDGDTTLASWAQTAQQSNWQKGSIEFMDQDRKVLKTLKWEDGYLTNYTIDYSPEHQHVLEQVTIMPRVLEVEGKSIDFEWDEGN